ncbi:MAG: 50S ribosomal protein L17 [bacterium]
MRHRKNNVKLGRSSAHRKALVASLVCNFIEQQQIRTTLPKARQARSMAEKMVTLAKANTLAARRNAIAELRRVGHVAKLFKEIAPQFADRQGGYTRIVKLGQRHSDGSEMAMLQWVDIGPRIRKAKPEAKAVVKAEDKPGADK